MIDKGMFFYGADGYLKRFMPVVETFEESSIATGLAMMAQAQEDATSTPASTSAPVAAPVAAPQQTVSANTTSQAVAAPQQTTSTTDTQDETKEQELSEPQRTYNMYETYRPLFRKYTLAAYNSVMEEDIKHVKRFVMQAKPMAPMQTSAMRSASTLVETARAVRDVIAQAMAENNGQIESLHKLQQNNQQRQEDINYWDGLIKEHERTLLFWIELVDKREPKQQGIASGRVDLELAKRYIKEMQEVLTRARQYIRELKASMQSDANAAKDINDMIAQGQASFNEIRMNGRKQIGDQIVAIRKLISEIRPPVLELISTYTVVLARLLKYQEFFEYMEKTISQPIAKKSEWIYSNSLAVS